MIFEVFEKCEFHFFVRHSTVFCSCRESHLRMKESLVSFLHVLWGGLDRYFEKSCFVDLVGIHQSGL